MRTRSWFIYSLCTVWSVALLIVCKNYLDLSGRRELCTSTIRKDVRSSPIQCSLNETKLGPLGVNVTFCNKADTSTIHGLGMGGTWKPDDCVTQEKTAIIIPYRDRQQHLSCLLSILIPVLQRQLLNFRVFVVEQEGTELFNKGTLFNAAFIEAIHLDNFDCFIFHDVDLIPEDDRNLYTCSTMPRHMSVSIDKFKYKLIYAGLVGGVLGLRREHFLKVNGFSNMYWGWGAEDDDMYSRIEMVRYDLQRPPASIARYQMIKHTRGRELPSALKLGLLERAGERYREDGLNSAQYNVTFIKNVPLYTHVMINVGQPPEYILNLSKRIFRTTQNPIPPVN